MNFLPLIFVLFAACATAAPDLAPLPEKTQATNSDLAELGRHLFFDKRLSIDWGTSCASCHNPMSGWSDGQALARGYGMLEYFPEAPTPLKNFRNTPTLLNAKFQKKFGWDGRFTDLKQAIREMVTGAHFMNTDTGIVTERVKQIPQYVAIWKKVYGTDSEPSESGLFAAIGEFVMTIPSGTAPIERYLDGDQNALSTQAQQGLELFRGKANCIACHSGPAGSDGKFHRLGLPENPEILQDPQRMMTMLDHYAGLGMKNYMNARKDVGLYAITDDPNDIAKFRTPELRGLRHTAPYMHNGIFRTLEQVVDFHDRGGGPDGELKPLGLNTDEKKALVALLDAMSGDPAMIELPAAPEFAVQQLTHKARRLTQASPSSKGPYPSLGPLPPVPAPADNPMTAEKIALGRKLFSDGRLSGNGQVSCISCHLPRLGWGDGQPVSRAYPGTRNWRNALPVINAAYYQKLFWDGRTNSLEVQASEADASPIEANGNAAMIEMRLRFVPEYVEQFRKAFGTEWPQIAQVWQAIATYERTIVSNPANVPFDRYMNGDKRALNPSALRGYRLFRGKANCIACHNGPFATDQKFYALGVPAFEGFSSDPLQQITHRWKQAEKGHGEAYGDDNGLYNVTNDPKDIGKFRTPSLRELKYTAPYMHNGAFATLIDVVKFFNRGGTSGALTMKPLGLDAREEMDLVAFLEALSMELPRLESDQALPAYSVMK